MKVNVDVGLELSNQVRTGLALEGWTIMGFKSAHQT